MATNEKLNRLKSCISLSSSSLKSPTKLKIPPAYVPDEWVCNHKHKRHSHDHNNAVKHPYVKPNAALKRESFSNNNKDKPKLVKRVLSPIPARINLKATPTETTNKKYFNIERNLELIRVKEKLEKEEKETSEKRLNVEQASLGGVKRLERFSHILGELKVARKVKSVKLLKRLKKRLFLLSKKSRKKNRAIASPTKKIKRPVDLSNFKATKIFMRVISAKKLKEKLFRRKLLRKNETVKVKNKKRLNKIRKNFLGHNNNKNRTDNFCFYFFSRKKYTKL